jgi:hypothetical protein
MRGAPLIGISLLAAGGFSVSGLAPVLNPPSTPAGLEAHETHASASLLGQFRTSTSSWLWLRTDLYLHNGVEMRQMTEGERHAGLVTEDAAEDGNKKLIDESTVLTIVPPKNRDFRGVFGDIERATSSYKDMHNHKHNDPIAALPLFRLMTWIDPAFIPGWVTGASVIARDHTLPAAMTSINYLKQGLVENPKSVAILNEIGEMYISRVHNLNKAVGYLEQARAIGRHREWIALDSERDALEQAYRWLALCYRDLGMTDNMRTVSAEGLKLFKDDVVLSRLLSTPPIVLTQEYQKEWVREHTRS